MLPGDIIQSVLAPAGTQAHAIHRLWLLMLRTAVAVFVSTLGFVALALRRGLRRTSTDGASSPSTSALNRGVAGAVALTVVILAGLLVASVGAGRSLGSLHAASAVSINVIGHQWWWEIEYEDAVPARQILTANEIHIPTGRPIVLKVTSRDVIHSFWVPTLHGKRDLIPGYTTAIWLNDERAGVFRGQCAEFCGLQHAHMAFDVVAESPADFERWQGAMRQPAQAPDSSAERRGHDVFMANRCAGCHTVNGSGAHGQVAPDLTHVASRGTLGAGTLPNTREHMLAWVRDPQASKPGNQMPPNPLGAEDLDALLAYLESLK